jgi:hypothetical protein
MALFLELPRFSAFAADGAAGDPGDRYPPIRQLSRRFPVDVSVTIRPQHREARILAQMQEDDAPRIKSGAGSEARR